MGMARIGIVAFSIAAGLAPGGCAGRAPSLSDLPDRELVGHYTGGSGESWFRPCGAPDGDPSWWVTFTGASVEPSRSRLAPGERTFVRFRAAVTTSGEVGPQGPGIPAVLVREILEAAPASAGDCAGR